MIARINAKVEHALRDAMSRVPRIEPDQIDAPLAALDDDERTEAIALSIMVVGYVVVDVCGAQWPDHGDLRQIANDLATTGTTAERLRLDADEIYAYLSRTVTGGEKLEKMISPDDPRFTRLPVIVAQRAVVVYSKDMDWWIYMDQIEAAIEVAWALDATVLPAAVMRAYLPKPEVES